jgi:PAP2 superfamily
MGATASIRRCVGVLALSLTGCTTLANGRTWGEDATFAPGWERVRVSAVNAERDPWTWVPLLGAAALQIDNWDHRISDWARTETPIFGSTADAERWSDDLRNASILAHAATVVFTPSGSSGPAWLLDKAKGFGVQLSAAAVANGTTTLLKKTTDRERPNGSSTESFPSGHATTSSVYDRMAEENLESIEMSRATRLGVAIGLDALTVSTSWARVEAGAHFPSDTLVSVALGNFCGMFFNDAFLGLDSTGASLALVPLPRGGEVRWQVSFGER